MLNDSANRELASINEEINQYRSVLEQCIDAVVTIDQNNTVTFFNGAAEALWGYAREEVLGHNVNLLVPAAIRTQHDDFVDDNRRTGVNKIVGTSREVLIERKDGSNFWGSMSLSRVDAGEEIHYTAFVRDITQEKAQRETFENLSTVANNTDNSVVVTDRFGCIEYVNPGFTKLTGYTIEHSRGKKPGDLLQGEHTCRETVKRIRQRLDAGKPFYDEILNYDRDGSSYWISLAINPVFDDHGALKCFVSIQSDITATKTRALEYHYRMAAIDRANAVVELDLTGKIIAANDNYLAILDTPRDQLLHRHLDEMLHPDYVGCDEHRRLWRKLRCGDFVSGEFQYRTDSGATRWINGAFNPIFNTRGDITKIVMHGDDATARKAVAAELDIARQRAEASVRAKAAFLASMSHEIRTPMNGVLGMLSLLKLDQLDEKQRHYVDLASSSAESLLSLLDDILDFSKIEAGKIELETLTFEPRALLGDVMASIALKAQEKGLEILLDATAIPNRMIEADPSRLRQILTNLVGNAIKFTTRGEIRLTASLDLDHCRLHCAVTDTGIGIPRDKLPDLFASFTQVDASTTRKYGGTGLGLAISHQLCRLMGGHGIRVASEVGRGSEFSFSIPVILCEHGSPVLPTIDIHGTRILVVDENETNRMILRTQLQGWGGIVETCDDGAAALALIEKSPAPPFDVVILDTDMPTLNGMEVAARIRANKALDAMHLMVMTTVGEIGDAKSYADRGFAAYFTKPVTIGDLHKALSVLVDRGEALERSRPLLTRHHVREMTSAQDNRHEGLAARILLVEDNAINQKVVATLLEDSGHAIAIATNGVEALARLKQADKPFDIVLMDCQMPEMDGYTATRNIRQGEGGSGNRDIPIIALTANAMKGDRELCLAAGMNDYLTKPIDFVKLEAAIEYWLMQRDGLSPATAPAARATDSETANDQAVNGIWDGEALLRRVRGKPERVTHFLATFLQDSTQLHTQLHQAVASFDRAEIGRHAHAFKGIAANLAAGRLAELAAALDKSAREQQREQIDLLWREFDQSYHELLDVFRQTLAARDG